MSDEDYLRLKNSSSDPNDWTSGSGLWVDKLVLVIIWLIIIGFSILLYFNHGWLISFTGAVFSLSIFKLFGIVETYRLQIDVLTRTVNDQSAIINSLVKDASD